MSSLFWSPDTTFTSAQQHSPPPPIAALHFSHHHFSISLAQTQHIVWLTHHFRSLPATLPLCVSLSLFAVVLVSQPGSRQHNMRLLCSCPQLKALSRCCTISLSYRTVSHLCPSVALFLLHCLFDSLCFDIWQCFAREIFSHQASGLNVNLFRSSTFSQTDTDKLATHHHVLFTWECAIHFAIIFVNSTEL